MTEQRLDFRKALKAAKDEFLVVQEELGDCLAKQEEFEKRLAALRQVINGFSGALGEQFEETDEIGMTDAVRQALKSYDKPLEPLDVRTRLQQLGFNTNKYGNFMASVHTVLSRLTKRGEVKQVVVQPGNKAAYVWVIPIPPPPKPTDVEKSGMRG
jgi:hypothetical protein